MSGAPLGWAQTKMKHKFHILVNKEYSFHIILARIGHRDCERHAKGHRGGQGPESGEIILGDFEPMRGMLNDGAERAIRDGYDRYATRSDCPG
jgi:hypothetical protein